MEDQQKYQSKKEQFGSMDFIGLIVGIILLGTGII